MKYTHSKTTGDWQPTPNGITETEEFIDLQGQHESRQTREKPLLTNVFTPPEQSRLLIGHMHDDTPSRTHCRPQSSNAPTAGTQLADGKALRCAFSHHSFPSESGDLLGTSLLSDSVVLNYPATTSGVHKSSFALLSRTISLICKFQLRPQTALHLLGYSRFWVFLVSPAHKAVRTTCCPFSKVTVLQPVFKEH